MMELQCKKASEPPPGTHLHHPFHLCHHHHHHHPHYHHHHIVFHHHHYHRQQLQKPFICSPKAPCAIHNSLCVAKGHSKLCPSFTFSPPILCPFSQHHEVVASVSSPIDFKFEVSAVKDVDESGAALEELCTEELEEEEEEPVFVLTDEWAEFFAKSEAKRRLEKKQAKKKGKN